MQIKKAIPLTIIILILLFTQTAFDNLAKQFICKDKYITDITGTITGFTDSYKKNCIK